MLKQFLVLQSDYDDYTEIYGIFLAKSEEELQKHFTKKNINGQKYKSFSIQEIQNKYNISEIDDNDDFLETLIGYA